MKFLFTILVVFFFKGSPNPLAERWVIQKSSNLTIEGKTNISGFRCDIKEYLQPDTIWFFRMQKTGNRYLSGAVCQST